MKFIFSFIILIASICQQPVLAQSKKEAGILVQIETNLRDAARQYEVMMQLVPPGQFPRTYNAGIDKFVTSNSSWWCSGFYPGSLLYLYKESKNKVFLDEANRMLGFLEKEKNNKNTHDLGFMMYCSFGNANKLNPSEKYKDILLTSAQSLSIRFNPAVGCIKSWNGKPGEYLVIIDNMMNLELLFWATKVTGDSSYYKIATTHANTTMQHHFRDDYSSYHVVNYNSQTGAINERKTAQGFSDASAWARGQAWGLYGYTMTYRETRDQRYLDQANHIARFILKHKNYPADGIPYWDFDADNIPDALRDVSAAAVMASALLELSTYSKENKKTYKAAAEKIIMSLSSDRYKAKIGTNGGFILEHSVGSIPHKSEVDVPLTYADYYFLEAMLRYKSLVETGKI